MAYRRRDFLNKLGLGCASVGATSLLSGITNLGLINAATAAGKKHSFFTPANDDYKALVCIMLSGGADSWNLLIPRGDAEYADYAGIRGSLAIPQNNLLPINPLTSDGNEYGLHPNFSRIRDLFHDQNLALVTNLGPLIQPSSRGNIIQPPTGLFSHSDQSTHWHTALYDQGSGTGWGGRIADILASQNANENISMNVSLAGNNTFQSGNTVQPYVVTNSGGGAIQLNGINETNIYETIKRQTLDNLLEVEYANTLSKAYGSVFQQANGTGFEFVSAINNSPNFNTAFPGNGFGSDLEMVARVISGRDQLGFSRQVFFISFGGFDMHTNVLNRWANNVTVIDEALYTFYQALEQMGVADKVTTYTMSDFGRKLSSNGSGSDHGWGGNYMVMGGAVKGGEIYGDFPELNNSAIQSNGNGRMIPTTSTDEYFAELALWFGVPPGDLEHIFPTLSNFWMPGQGNPLGFMS